MCVCILFLCEKSLPAALRGWEVAETNERNWCPGDVAGWLSPYRLRFVHWWHSVDCFTGLDTSHSLLLDLSRGPSTLMVIVRVWTCFDDVIGSGSVWNCGGDLAWILGHIWRGSLGHIWHGSVSMFDMVPWAYLVRFLGHIWHGSLSIFGVVPWAYLAWFLGHIWRWIDGYLGVV